ncbi:hypothetical protein BJV74DRAFT_884185 [Russula compacta]|nr:hypothetical protein BJV74DRAFT_884185 [Russula compacta]
MSDSESSNHDSEADEDIQNLLSIEDAWWDSDQDDKGDVISDFDADDEESDKEVIRPSPRQWVQTRIKEIIIMKISDDPVFLNKSNTPQQPIEEQVAIMLFQFGHYGNAASLQNVANWAGVSKGTITVATQCVMTAILCPSFM